MTIRPRAALLDLVQLRPSLAVAMSAVAGATAFEDGPAVVLRRTDLLKAIELHASGQLTDQDLEDWAEAIHGAEEIELDDADRAVLSQAVFELSTPELFGDMSDLVRALRTRIRPE